MAKAYASLTITDLLDIATYIYYSPNVNGNDATIMPDSSSQYIGIYTGPALPGGQPGFPPKGTIWSKYVGDKGDEGKPAPEVKAQYSADRKSWHETYQQGDLYVRYCYNGKNDWYPPDGIKIVGDNGKDGNAYEIITNSEEILKYVMTNEKTNSVTVAFSPEKLHVKCYKVSGFTKELQNTAEGDLEKGTLVVEGYSPSSRNWVVLYDGLKVPTTPGVDITNQGPFSVNTVLQEVTLDFKKFQEEVENSEDSEFTQFRGMDIILRISYQQLGEGNTYSAIPDEEAFNQLKSKNIKVYFSPTEGQYKEYNDAVYTSEKTLLKADQTIIKHAVKVIPVRFSESEDLAKLSVHANGIFAALQNKRLSFTGDGLSVVNSGFTISKEEYKPLTQKEFNSARDEARPIYRQEKESQKYELYSGEYNPNESYAVLEKTQQLYTENGDLVVSGIIRANDGYFKGEINATGGKFSGPVSIEEKAVIGKQSESQIILDGKQENAIYSSNFSEKKGEGFKLTAEGNICANSLNIGEGRIDRILHIGDGCYIQKPNENEEYRFLSVQDKNHNNLLSLTSDGRMQVGKGTLGKGITLNGVKNTIETSNFISGAKGWRISPERAEFNNVVVRGTIETSVLASGSTQAIGGSLLIRPSTEIRTFIEATIEEKTNLGLTQEEKVYKVHPETLSNGIQENDYCKISSLTQIFKVKKIVNGIIYLIVVGGDKTSSLTLNVDSAVLVSYGSTTGNNSNVGIAINSSNTSASCPPRAMTIFESQITEETLNNDANLVLDPKIILGDLSQTGGQYGGLTGYGLYANNVFLKGALISTNEAGAQETFYSGVNSDSKIKMPESDFNTPTGFFPKRKVGNILFWAGAKTSDSLDIQNAPFKVDSYGNLYAGSGYFNGTIISNAEITAAKIKTAILEGWNVGVNSAAALTIKNADTAIRFISETSEGVETEKLVLKSDKIRSDIPIEIGDQIRIDVNQGLTFSTTKQGDFTPQNKTDTININSEGLVLNKIYSNGETIKGNISVGQVGGNGVFLQKGIAIKINDKETVLFSENSANVQCDLKVKQKIMLNENVEWRPAIKEGKNIGYDLYVYE